MLKRYAIIDGQQVVNSIEYPNDPGNPPPGFASPIIAVQSDVAGPGWTYVDNEFISPINPVVFVPQEISRRQFFQQLAVMQLITDDEALAAVGPNVVPSFLMDAVNNLPQDQQFPAKMLLTGAVIFSRSNPLIDELGNQLGWTSAQIDALWIEASVL